MPTTDPLHPCVHFSGMLRKAPLPASTLPVYPRQERFELSGDRESSPRRAWLALLLQVSGTGAVGCAKLSVAAGADRALLLRQVRSIMERARLHELFVELRDS